MNKKEIKKEHKYLEKVLNLMSDQVTELKDKIDNKKADIIESKREMFESAPTSIRDFDDVIELSMQNDYIKEKTDDYQMLLDKLNRLLELQITPYYGRIDYKDINSKQYKPFYIGKYSFCDSNLFDYYIYDWRAPISSLFYDYDIGEASFETPNGTRHGNINLKRQYEIASGVIEYMNDTKSIAKDEIFAKVLSENTSKKLKVIISSIQKEQNRAIRYMKSKHLLIFGPAGSGKTSVGLHRLAYILYHDRDKIASKNVAVISNNNIFDSYISNIIPELGEEGINQFIFSSLIKPYIPNGYDEIDYYEQVDYLMNATENDTRIKGIEIKGSYDFLEYIEESFRNMSLSLHDLTYDDEIICTKQELDDLFNNDLSKSSLRELISRINYYIQSQFEDYFLLNKKEIKLKIADKSDDFLSESQIDAIYQNNLNEGIKTSKKLIVESNSLEEISMYLMILENYILEKEYDIKILEQTKHNLKMKMLYHEDCIAVMCIKILLNKINVDSSIKHVLIDEAQDYSLLQLFFIRNLFANSDFTILADTNQAIHPFISTNKKQYFNNIFKDKAKQLCLNRSYRSSGPINKLSFDLLQESDDIEYFNRSGEKPSFLITDKIGDSILEIVQNNNSSKNLIGILVKTKEQAESLYLELKDKLDVQLISKPSDKLEKNIIILPIILAKGLEFDIVIADISNDKYEWYDKNILYLMCTRALHRLYILSSNDLPHMLKDSKPLLKMINEA